MEQGDADDTYAQDVFKNIAVVFGQRLTMRARVSTGSEDEESEEEENEKVISTCSTNQLEEVNQNLAGTAANNIASGIEEINLGEENVAEGSASTSSHASTETKGVVSILKTPELRRSSRKKVSFSKTSSVSSGDEIEIIEPEHKSNAAAEENTVPIVRIFPVDINSPDFKVSQNVNTIDSKLFKRTASGSNQPQHVRKILFEDVSSRASSHGDGDNNAVSKLFKTPAPVRQRQQPDSTRTEILNTALEADSSRGPSKPFHKGKSATDFNICDDVGTGIDDSTLFRIPAPVPDKQQPESTEVLNAGLLEEADASRPSKPFHRRKSSTVYKIPDNVDVANWKPMIRAFVPQQQKQQPESAPVENIELENDSSDKDEVAGSSTSSHKRKSAFPGKTVNSAAYLMRLNDAKQQKKSKQDLNDLDSYKITGMWVDEQGQTRYYCEWKDGD